MYRLFCVLKAPPKGLIFISERDQIHHISNVLHLKASEEIIVFDEKGNEYDTVIDKITARNIILKVRDMKKNICDNKIRVTVACAIPKKSKFDDIIDKLTQLGADRIIPMETERVVIKLDRHKKDLRLSRWNKIAVSASEQSQRNSLPVIDPVRNIKQVLMESGDYDLKLIPSLIDERKSLNRIFQDISPKNILVLIGPEGDFSPSEVVLAKKAGFIPVTLGANVLRVETAAVAVVSFIKLVLFFEQQYG